MGCNEKNASRASRHFEKQIEALILSGQTLHRFSPKEISVVLSKLPKTINELDFSNGGLQHLDVNGFIEVISNRI
nr:hypothetical protein [Legionella jordanis]